MKKLYCVFVLFVFNIAFIKSQNYAGFSGGLISFSELDDDMKTLFGGEASFGHFVNDNLVIEGNLGYYLRSKSNSTSIMGTTISSKISNSSLLIEGELKYLLTTSNVAFYLCGNAGLNNFKISVSTNDQKNSSSYTFFGILPGAGLFLNKDEDVMFKIEAKYAIFFSNNEFGSDLTGPYLTVGIFKNF